MLSLARQSSAAGVRQLASITRVSEMEHTDAQVEPMDKKRARARRMHLLGVILERWLIVGERWVPSSKRGKKDSN